MDINLLMMIVLIALMAWMMFSAQKRQRKQMEALREMQRSLTRGTRVMTGSGFYGTIVSVDIDNNKAELELAEDVVITVALNAIMSVVDDEAPAAPLSQEGAEAPAASESSSETTK